MALTFYYGSGSAYAWKVWLALEHKGIPYDFKLLSFDRGDTKAPAFLAINPRGKVPTIDDNGFALGESTAILEYLEEAYPQKPLLPKDAKQRAVVRRMVMEADNELGELVNAFVRATLFTPAEKHEPEKIAELQNSIVSEMGKWEAQLGGEYLAGPLSFADFTLYPFVRTLRRIEERQAKYGIAKRIPAKLAAWMKRIEALPYFEKTTPPHWKG